MKVFIPRDERRPVSLRGFALSPSRDIDIRIADLSYAGCQIRSPDALKPGEVLELRILKGGAADVEIRWSAEGKAGAQFVN
jgi:hypothetical protein